MHDSFDGFIRVSTPNERPPTKQPSYSVIGVQCECTIQHCGTALSVTDNIRERITSSGQGYGIVSPISSTCRTSQTASARSRS